MAKGRLSKIKKRFRASKRLLLEQEDLPETAKLNRTLRLTSKGLPFRQSAPKNAFTNPDDPDAEFPQYVHPKLYDFRSHKNPFSGTEYNGNVNKKKKKITNGIVYAHMVGEPEPETLNLNKTARVAVDEGAMIDQLLDMQINKSEKKPDRSGMELEDHTAQKKGKQKYMKRSSKGLKKIVRF